MKFIRSAAAVAAVGGVVVGAALGLAGPASAAPPEGTYTNTVIDGATIYKDGAVNQMTFTSCGPDCVHARSDAGGERDFHLQGNDWVSAADNGVTITFNNDSLQGEMVSSKGTYHVTFALTKNA